MFNISKKWLILMALSLFLISFASGSAYIDINTVEVDDSSIVYGETINVNVVYTNTGDANATDYSINFYLGDSLIEAYNPDSNLNVDENSSYSFEWTADDVGELDINVCSIVNEDLSDCNAEISINVLAVDLNSEISINDADNIINFGTNVVITNTFGNNGTADATELYTLYYYINGNLYESYEITDDLSVDSTDTNSYTWDSNIIGDINLMVCTSYGDYDLNIDNNCDSLELTVKAARISITDISLDDSSVKEGNTVEVTVDYKNTGNLLLNASEESYTIKFYRNTTLLKTYTIDDDLSINEEESQTYSFTAPTVSSTTDYDIEARITYSRLNSEDDDDDVTVTDEVELEVTNSSSSSGSSSSSSSSSSKVDFKADSLTAPTKLKLGETTKLIFKAKNIGGKTSSDEYALKIISKLGEITKTICIESGLDDEIAKNKYVDNLECNWKPEAVGKYTLTANIKYDSSESSTSNNSITKVVEVYVESANIISADKNVDETTLILRSTDTNHQSDENKVADINVILDQNESILLLQDVNMPLRNSKVKVILPDGNSVEYQTDENGYILADFNVAGRYYIDYLDTNGNVITKIVEVSENSVNVDADRKIDYGLLIWIIVIIIIAGILGGILYILINNIKENSGLGYSGGRPKQLTNDEQISKRKFSYSTELPKPKFKDNDSPKSLMLKGKASGLERIK